MDCWKIKFKKVCYLAEKNGWIKGQFVSKKGICDVKNEKVKLKRILYNSED